jgi:hypothetical protein
MTEHKVEVTLLVFPFDESVKKLNTISYFQTKMQLK